jgi:hypothetical protein
MTTGTIDPRLSTARVQSVGKLVDYISKRLTTTVLQAIPESFGFVAIVLVHGRYNQGYGVTMIKMQSATLPTGSPFEPLPDIKLCQRTIKTPCG